MTAAGGGRKEQFCGGGTELKEALLGDAQRRFRRVLKGSVFAEEEQSAEQRRREICSRASCDGKSTQCSYRHSETEEISTGCGASGGVTKLKEAL